MDTRQIVQEGKHKPEDRLEVLLHEYNAFQTRYQNLWAMRMRWIAGITTIFASGLVWASGLVVKFISQDFQEFVQISTKVVIMVLPHVLTFGAGVIITLELFLRQDGLYLNHIEKKVNRVAGLELLQYYTKYSRVLGGTGYEFLGIFPMSIMTIIYLMYLLPFFGLWIYIIGLAIARYIFNNPDFPCWKEVMFIVVYIGEFVATVVLSIFGYRMTNKRFEHIINQDRVWTKIEILKNQKKE